jgi:hypothetical protein
MPGQCPQVADSASDLRCNPCIVHNAATMIRNAACLYLGNRPQRRKLLKKELTGDSP